MGVWAMANRRERLKTGAADLQEQQHDWRVEFFAYRSRPCKPSPLLALLITDYWLLITGY
jgi:hypothetical protein